MGLNDKTAGGMSHSSCTEPPGVVSTQLIRVIHRFIVRFVISNCADRRRKHPEIFWWAASPFAVSSAHDELNSLSPLGVFQLTARGRELDRRRRMLPWMEYWSGPQIAAWVT